MNFSQEVVQEFQLSSTNFDLSTGITSVGGVNIVTRTGGNEFHGSGYFFFRDHNMAAYPGLKRICQEPSAPALCNNPAERKALADPFFARRNPGVWVGGPIIKDRLNFFTNYEYTNQTSVRYFSTELRACKRPGGQFCQSYTVAIYSAPALTGECRTSTARFCVIRMIRTKASGRTAERFCRQTGYRTRTFPTRESLG